jgi:uncharacterized protein YndB with AHSA1/START domain
MTHHDLSFTYETYIRATPERVWQAFTDGDLTARYFYGARVQSTWRPGDEIVFVGPDGTTRMSAGTIAEADPGRRLVYRARLLYDPEVAKDAPIRLTWEIAPLGEVCKLVLTHDEFEGQTATYRAVTGGVPVLMASIKSLLETGEPLSVAQ